MVFDPGLREYGWETGDSSADHAYTLPAIVKPLPRGRLTVLDAGCSNGAIAGKLSEMGYQVTGTDLSEDGIAIAKDSHPGVHFEVASVYDDLRPLLAEVDIFVSSEVIEHLYYPQRYLANMYSMIKPGGVIILKTPYHGHWKNLALSIANYWDKHHTVDQEGGHIKFFHSKPLQTCCYFVAFLESYSTMPGGFSGCGNPWCAGHKRL